MGFTNRWGLKYANAADLANMALISQNLANTVETALSEVDDSRQADLVRIPATPAATADPGSPSSGTTEIRDTVLPVYTCITQVAGRYRVVYAGLKVSGTAVADLFTINIRNGGSGVPGLSSTIVATDAKYIAAIGGAGQEGLSISKTFMSGAGAAVTLAAFIQRASGGSGVGTPIGDRELYIEYMGPI
jgi:hypothetical protein